MTATMPASTDVRDCRLYRFYGWDPRTNYTTKTLIYIGETGRQPLERLLEHIYDKPWADTITSWEVDDRVFAGKRQVLEAEAAAIRAERPLYNMRGNEDNEDRIIPPVAIRQRRARDAERGRARWTHPDDRNRSDLSTSLMPDRRISVPRKWTALQVKACLWSMSWLAIAVSIWGFLDRNGLFESWRQRVLCGLVCAPFLIVWSVLRRPDTVAMWRRRLKRIRRALR